MASDFLLSSSSGYSESSSIKTSIYFS